MPLTKTAGWKSLSGNPNSTGLERSASTGIQAFSGRWSRLRGNRERFLAPLKEDLVLADCGLDSLGFAVLVARLEDKLGIDPFTAAQDALFPVTLGDFVKIYEHAAPNLRA